MTTVAAAPEPVFVDTNVLIYAAIPAFPWHLNDSRVGSKSFPSLRALEDRAVGDRALEDFGQPRGNLSAD
jgi:hypothetical protein